MRKKEISQMKFVQQLSELPFVSKIILYGSRARGDHRDRSDIDIAVECHDATREDWLAVVEIVEQADTLLKIDCVQFDTLSKQNPLRQAIEREGKDLFVRELSVTQKIKLAFTKLDKSLNALELAVNLPEQENRINIDACIKRFEFSIELFWKTLKIIMESKGAQLSFPKEVLQAAYQAGLIDHEKIWLAMVNDRNQTSHTYDEDLADEIYQHIKKYFPIMKDTYLKLVKKYT